MTGVAALLAGLGAVALGFGILSALMALLQPYTDPLWIFGNLVAGAVLLGASIVMSFDVLRERMRSEGSRRAGLVGSSAIVNALLSILILAALGFLSARYATRFDVSESGVHTMALQTTKLLDNLEQDVSITAFFLEAEAPPIRDLLDRYAFASERVDLRFIDPNAAPGLVESLELSSEDLAKGVVRLSLESGDAITLREFSESAVTNAIRKLAMSTGKKVYFLEGHNERRVNSQPEADGSPAVGYATSPDSFGRAAQALRNETYEVESLLLATIGDVPADASVVVIAGPTRPLIGNEIEVLRRYVEGGGSVFMAIDPRSQTNLYGLLEHWGISLGDDVIVDRALAVFGQATTPLAGEYDGRHPITKDLREPTLFPLVRSVHVDDALEAQYSILAKTSNDSWAERDLDAWRDSGRAELGPGDIVGPVPIAVAGTPWIAPASEGAQALEGAPAETASLAGRVVVFGDSDFATNEFIDALRNRDLFVNSVNWLAGDIEQISVRPNTSRASSFQMSQEEFRRIQYLSLFVLPEAIAIFGVIVWWRRRRIPQMSEESVR
ncbi:MAG TPA: hypothetical protein EYQ60_10720 [Myxococcales bacterium]|nr:hypothetical protein [Myxococcales bacterium]HIK85273.1 hypothetical protein [Myxococcales bacterium]